MTRSEHSELVPKAELESPLAAARYRLGHAKLQVRTGPCLVDERGRETQVVAPLCRHPGLKLHQRLDARTERQPGGKIGLIGRRATLEEDRAGIGIEPAVALT